jgi:HD-like signal output (HDOD) protein/CheY-like chemotaxis protein
MSNSHIRILFVDDEAMVLDGIRRVLRLRRPEWQAFFAGSAPAALETLAREPVDVLVTDLKMPGMSGLDLLDRVRESYPHLVRMVLSGRTDTADMASRLGRVHQFLQKPCDADTMIATIERTAGLVRMLRSDRLREIAARTVALPAWPERLSELNEELAREDTSAALVAAVIARDSGLTTKVLHMANSSFFGSARRILNVHDAVARIGMRTVRSVLLTAHVFDALHAPGPVARVRETIWNHSLSLADKARKVGLDLSLPSTAIEAGQLAAMLSHVGRLLLASTFGDDYLNAIAHRPPRTTVAQAETELYGATFADLGAYLLGLWGFDEHVVNAVALQETPARGVRQIDHTLLLVHLARCTVPYTPAGTTLIDRLTPDAEFLARHGLDNNHPVLNRANERIAA